jgi:hypothetical protein
MWELVGYVFSKGGEGHVPKSATALRFSGRLMMWAGIEEKCGRNVLNFVL